MIFVLILSNLVGLELVSIKHGILLYKKLNILFLKLTIVMHDLKLKNLHFLTVAYYHLLWVILTYFNSMCRCPVTGTCHKSANLHRKFSKVCD